MNINQSVMAFLMISIILISPAVAQYQIPIPSQQYIPSPQPSIDTQIQQQQALQNSLIQQSLQQQSMLTQQQSLSSQQNGLAMPMGQNPPINTPSGYRNNVAGSAGSIIAPGLAVQFLETSYYLKDVAFVTGDIGWAVGAPHWSSSDKMFHGTILKTIDGGKTWTPQEAETTETLCAVFFLDNNQGWAAGTNGAFLHTIDGGDHWVLQNVNTSEEFRGLAFTDSMNGWATSTMPIHKDWRGKDDDWIASIWHTTDGGLTWRRQALPDNVSILNRIDFIDPMIGWAVGVKRTGTDGIDILHSGVIYFTDDGGETWKEQYSSGEQVTLTAVDFIDISNGWVAGFPSSSTLQGGFVYHTTDGGRTWNRQEPGGFDEPLWDIQFIDKNRGYATGTDYISAWGPPVWRTTDGGETWTKIRMKEGDSIMAEGFFALAIVGDRVVLVGDHDLIARSERAWGPCPETSSSGETCYNCDCLFKQHYISTHYILHDLFFADNESGWAVGSLSNEPGFWGQVILHTSDGGNTWMTQYKDAPSLDELFSYHRLDSVSFIDSKNGWAVGTSKTISREHKGAIMHTKDGGMTWENEGSNLYDQWDLEFFDVEFLNDKEGWALATKRFPSQNIFLAHTLDGGNHWNWVDTGIQGNLAIGFAFVQGDLQLIGKDIWAAGGLGTVIHSSDGGATWTKQKLSCSYPTCPLRTFAIASLNTSNGWLAGEKLFSTDNGGESWNQMNPGVEGDVQDIQVLDNHSIWMVGEKGLIERSIDGGQTWQNIPLGANLDLLGLFFIDPEHGWIAGDRGIILRYSSNNSK